MARLYRHNYVAILIHILLWVLFGFALLLYMPLNWGIPLPYKFLIKQATVLVLLIAVYYINAYLLVPRLLLKNRIAWFIFIIVTMVIICSLIIRETELMLNLMRMMGRARAGDGEHVFRERRPPFPDPFVTMMILLVVGISTSVTSILAWQRDDKKRQLLEQEKASSELAFLKAQINPHFFFNTMNNIYALTHIDVETSRTALHKLSRLMRYVLYDTHNARTPVSKEISFINDYIELMKLRLTEKVTIQFDPPHLLYDPEVAPMLFLPLVENAFKHGVSTVFPGNIAISLSVTKSTISLEIINTLFDMQVETKGETGGIGLINTRRRLNLLYPGRHVLTIEEDRVLNKFIARLELQT